MFNGLSEWYEGTEQVVDSMIKVLRWVRLSEKSWIQHAFFSPCAIFDPACQVDEHVV